MPAIWKQLGVTKLWRTPDRQKSAALIVSTIFHIGLIVLAGSLWFPQIRRDLPPAIDARWDALPDEERPFEPLETVEPLLNSKSPADLSRADSPSPVVSSIHGPPAPVTRPAGSVAASSDWFAEPYRADNMAMNVGAAPTNGGASAAETGTERGSADGDGGAFFGIKPSGRRFVYVIDCSLSMNHPHSSEAKTRFRRVKLELVSSIGGLTSDQQFFMVFFNDQATPMPAHGLEPASLAAKKRYLYWMQEIRANGLSEPTDAFRMALEMRPDVIHFLTDGAFSHKTEQELLAFPRGNTTIHTYAFAEQINERLELGMKLIQNDDFQQARKRLSKKELRTAHSLVRAQELLETLAKKHGGEFHLIP